MPIPLPEQNGLDPQVSAVHPPGFLVNFGPRVSTLLSGCEPAATTENTDSLWTWCGVTNVIYDGPQPTVLSGSWERGGGGRSRRIRHNPPVPSEELLIARGILLNSSLELTSVSPIALPSVAPVTVPPPVLSAPSLPVNEPAHLILQLGTMPPWNVDAGHFDLPPSHLRSSSTTLNS